MNYQKLLKSWLKHIINSKMNKLNNTEHKQKKILKFNMQLNQKIENIDSQQDLSKTESLIDNL